MGGKYVTVVWTDPKTGQTKRTTTQDPGKVERQVSQMGGTLKKQEVTPLKSGSTGRTIGTYTPPPAPKKTSSLPPTPIMQKIAEIQQITEPIHKPPIPYRTDAPMFPVAKSEIIQTSTSREAALIKDIKPKTSYIMGGETVLGSVVVSSVKKQEEQFRKSIKKYPKGSQFTFTPSTGGYSIKEPNTRLGFAKEVSKQMKGKPPILKQISEIGTGITYSAYSLAQIPVKLLGKESDFNLGFSLAMGKSLHPFDKEWINKAGALYKTTGQGIHMPTALDVAFEPIGWSPKGSTKFLKENPFVLGGSIGGEIGIMMGFTAGISGISSKVVKPALKGAVKTTPSIYSKMSTTFPKVFGKPIALESGKIIGHTTVSRTASKIFQTGFSKNIYGWAAKGWKPGKILVYRSMGEPVKRGGLLLQKGRFVAEKGSKRIWLTAKEVSQYKARLASSGILNIGFPTSKSVVGTGKVIGASEGFIWKRTLFGTLKKSAYTSTMHKKLGISVGRLVDDEPIKYGLGSYIRGKDIIKPVIDVGVKTDPWFKSVKSMYRYGYPQLSPLESGKLAVKSWTSGFGGGISKPLPKRWITKKLSVGFVKSQEATAGLISKSKTVLRYGAKTTRPWSIVTRVPGRVVPAVAFTIPSYLSTRATLGYLGSKQQITPKIKSIRIQQPTQIQSPISFQAHIKALTSIQVQERVPVSISSLENALSLKQVQDISFKQSLVSKMLLKQSAKLKSFTGFSHKGTTSIPIIPVMPFFKMGLSGRGMGSYGWDKKLRHKYRFRKFKIPSLEKLLGGK